MICPNCETQCQDQDFYCYRCGTQLRKPYQQPRKHGSLWIPCLLLCFISAAGLLCFFLFPNQAVQANASYDPEYSWFRIDDGVLSFDKDRYTGGDELIVPAELNGQIVRTIGDSCFENCDKLTAVILPDTITHIGQRAFADCISLRGIFIPESVVSIDREAFYRCSSLESVSLPSGLTAIGRDTFDECISLRFLFYNGSINAWEMLYAEFINPYAGVFCTDGSFYQGGNVYE